MKDESRRRTAAALSHDMRTPLSVIANGAQLIRMSLQEEVARRAAAAIGTNASRLGEMISELLNALAYHGSAQIPLSLSRFDIVDMLNDLQRENFRYGTDGVQVDLNGGSVWGYWCRGCMRRVVENLVNNAIKYGDQRPITIATRESRGRLMLSVHNEGNPIPESRHNHIFEYLSRDVQTASVPGWGIGLHFVRAVAESHGGSVSVDSSAETGTTFLIDVPVDCRPFVPS
ncbi:sensor histidine kinase [Pseudoduganella umbonata]|uniref:sensor histidine kinase n=1 Tax=Pseudoduganella umbonata TaxID=864828 RepID=UPI00353113FC